ncbi:MAG TPA: flagellar motor switch protein FliM, partial [Petrotogaceae bacterium]|nr:flagellar motor switch protein FliM [Petrotogaceae bacterium]
MVEGDKLSQDEIDKLLKNMTAPEGESEGSEKPFEEKKVREYNFRRPVKFSREQQRTLQLVHEN